MEEHEWFLKKVFEASESCGNTETKYLQSNWKITWFKSHIVKLLQNLLSLIIIGTFLAMF